MPPTNRRRHFGRPAYKKSRELGNTFRVSRRVEEHLDLLDFRRQVAALYAEVRDTDGPAPSNQWRSARDQLFANHPQSAVEDKESFTGLSYFRYDKSWRTVGTFRSDTPQKVSIPHSSAGATEFMRIGKVEFSVNANSAELEMLWLSAYGGGLFLPFRDQTNGDTTYGGGRYLLDTVKGADLGHHGDQIVLDFNYAYHPSCVHSPRWSCPLAPPGNNLSFSITAGERLSEGPSPQ